MPLDRTLSLIKTPPRVPELVFAAVLLWLFATGQGWTLLLADGDTGWHIRNGERILDMGSVPHSDPFSFGSAGHPWFSWEWMSDVLFAALFRMGGLKAVAVFSGIVISASVAVLFRHMIWRSVGVLIALPLALLAVGASSIHYLARPHAIGLFFFAVIAWIIDRDRASPGGRIWCLPLIFFLWANLHGSFLAGLAMLGFWFGERLFRLRAHLKGWAAPAILFTLSAGATLCNPYGWHLHAHALEYLRSSWIQNWVEEFQSPRFRSESMLQYEILLFAGLLAFPWLLRRRELYPCCAILFWAHESLASVRHVPLFCMAACPFTASWIQNQWNLMRRDWRPGSLLIIIDSINEKWTFWSPGFTAWPVILCIAVSFISLGSQPDISFPANKFPEELVERNLLMFAPTEAPWRIFSSDQWSDYLIFRLYPSVRVYFDGRSDFFGPWRGADYQQLMAGEADSPAILARENVDLALVPKDCALSGILRKDPQWHVADADDQAVLFRRTAVSE